MVAPTAGGGRDVSKRRLELSAFDLSSSHHVAYACQTAICQRKNNHNYRQICQVTARLVAQFTSPKSLGLDMNSVHGFIDSLKDRGFGQV